MILVTYTTLYRDGGRELERAAQTLARERGRHGPVLLAKVESKRDFVDAIARANAPLSELHFFGHSGMYGPMFRTTQMPEQFSPHEWRNLSIPFSKNGEAFFHACRTARWFAPFFARTFGVPASGYHWYTTFSTAPDRFVWEPPFARVPTRPLYLIGCRGKKSDGLAGSIMKYAGLIQPEAMKRFEPIVAGEPRAADDPSYNGVAELYADVFSDIRVRRDEWRWLMAHFPAAPARVLDIGCGNGALLRALGPRVARGVGVDASAGMVEAARRTSPDHFEFKVIDGPTLPFPDASFDVVTSLLSFRYLDWDPIMDEIRRVLAPGGKLLVVDMVTAPIGPTDVPRLVRDGVRARVQQASDKRYREALARLVKDPRWQTMLRYNPIRAVHEYVWYFESRFPGRKVETLNVGWHNRVLAFDSGPLAPGRVAPQSYP